MMIEQIRSEEAFPPSPEAASAAQLRREAAKARALADATFGEEERRQLAEIATALDREAAAIDVALAKASKRR